MNPMYSMSIHYILEPVPQSVMSTTDTLEQRMAGYPVKPPAKLPHPHHGPLPLTSGHNSKAVSAADRESVITVHDLGSEMSGKVYTFQPDSLLCTVRIKTSVIKNSARKITKCFNIKKKKFSILHILLPCAH
jgi:hypothetical protein